MLTKEDWQSIIYKDGKIDEEQVFKELHDYAFLMEQASQVYEHIAGLSKTNYYAGTIISEYKERCLDKEITKEDVANILKDSSDVDELKEQIKQYFEIN